MQGTLSDRYIAKDYKAAWTPVGCSILWWWRMMSCLGAGNSNLIPSPSCFHISSNATFLLYCHSMCTLSCFFLWGHDHVSKMPGVHSFFRHGNLLHAQPIRTLSRNSQIVWHFRLVILRELISKKRKFLLILEHELSILLYWLVLPWPTCLECTY